MEQNSIVVKNVTKKFDDFMLDHISFTVPTGRIVGFIGENGAGKSTTINLILDQLKLDAGEIRILGKQNHSYLHKENIGVVFDECKFHSVLNAKDIAQILSGSYKTWDMNLFEEYMKRLDVPLNKSIGQLSKGMKMKLSIICALSHRPQILILDEASGCALSTLHNLLSFLMKSRRLELARRITSASVHVREMTFTPEFLPL